MLSEKKSLEYEAFRWPCDMWITGGYVTKIKFPLATQSGSPLRDQLTYAIKKLKKNGAIANITSREYHKPYCATKPLWKTEAKKSITGQDLAGIYYLMMIGFGCTLILFTIETVYFYLRGGNIVQLPKMSRRKEEVSQAPRGGGGRGYDSGGGYGGGGSSDYPSREPEKKPADWI